MGSSSIEEFQRQALETLKAQQEAYLEAVRAWKEATLAGGTPPPWPEPPPLDSLPTPAELAEASAAFAARLFDEQSKFMRQLGETLAANSKKR